MSHKVGTREEWLAARKALLVKEKELTRARDALAAERRALPWVKIEKNYVFDMNTIKGCESIPEHWLSYVAVDDVDLRVKQALAAGGKPGRPPFDVAGVGRIAILQQPGGATVAWMTPKA